MKGKERKNGAIWQKAVTAKAAAASESNANGIKAKRNDEMPSLLDEEEKTNNAKIPLDYSVVHQD